MMTPDARSGSRPVTFLIYPDALLIDLAGPLQAFEFAHEAASNEVAAYQTRVVSPDGGLVRTSSGVQIMSEPMAAVGPSDTVIVAGGPGVHAASRDPRPLVWLEEQARTARRICSVCTGAFMLGAAGLLRGRRAATHWIYCSTLQDRHPTTIVEPDAIFVADGQIWTSAGATAGIDLALALIQEDLGYREAMRIARRMVVFLKRTGGQAQFSVPLQLQESDEGEFEKLHHWMQAHLSAELSVDVLASRAGMSPRTFSRRYAAQLGRTPAKAVEEMRLEAALRALEDTTLSHKQIAARCGFITEERMRRCFQRHLDVTPQDYKQRLSNACSPDDVRRAM